MTQLLKSAGLPQAILDLVPEVVDTCRVCRLPSVAKAEQ